VCHDTQYNILLAATDVPLLLLLLSLRSPPPPPPRRLALRVRRRPSCTQCWSSARLQWGVGCWAQTTSTSCQGKRGQRAPSAGGDCWLGVCCRQCVSWGGGGVAGASCCMGVMTHTAVCRRCRLLLYACVDSGSPEFNFGFVLRPLCAVSCCVWVEQSIAHGAVL
jgi:hypothetical protein